MMPVSFRHLFAAAVVTLPLMLGACAPKSEDAATAAPVKSAPAATASTAAPVATAGVTGPLPDVPTYPPVAHALKGPAPVEGQDYMVISGGVPYDAADGKIEVAELFNYICPGCNAFEASFASWAASLPADVRVIHVPAFAGFDPRWELYARAFYAAQAMNVADRTHQAIYNEVHRDGKLKGEHGQDSMDDIAAAYGRHGVDPATFKATATSFAIEGKLAHARQFALQSGINSTPMLVINGKYRVTGKKSWEDNLVIADHLIAKIRAEHAH